MTGRAAAAKAGGSAMIGGRHPRSDPARAPDPRWASRQRLGDILRTQAGGRSGAQTGSVLPPSSRRGAVGWIPPWARPQRQTGLGARGDRGSATVLVLVCGLLLASTGGLFALVGAARVARHQAQVAADLGALAGAVHTIEGTAAACAVASRFVRANGGQLSGCVVDGLDIVVEVDVAAALLPGPIHHAHAAARAGPVSAPPSS